MQLMLYFYDIFNVFKFDLDDCWATLAFRDFLLSKKQQIIGSIVSMCANWLHWSCSVALITTKFIQILQTFVSANLHIYISCKYMERYKEICW